MGNDLERFRIKRVPLRERLLPPWLFPYLWHRWDLEHWNDHPDAQWWDFCGSFTTRRGAQKWADDYQDAGWVLVKVEA